MTGIVYSKDDSDNNNEKQSLCISFNLTGPVTHIRLFHIDQI